MPSIPVSIGLQADRPAVSPWPCEWECCTGNCTADYRVCLKPFAHGMLGSKPINSDQPLTQGQRISVGVATIAVVVLTAAALFGVGYLVGSAHPDAAPAAKARVMP